MAGNDSDTKYLPVIDRRPTDWSSGFHSIYEISYTLRVATAERCEWSTYLNINYTGDFLCDPR